MDSTTSNTRPCASHCFFMRASESSPHTSPGFTSYTAETIERIPGICEIYCKGTGVGDKIFNSEKYEVLTQLISIANHLKETYGYWSFKKFVKDSKNNYDYMRELDHLNILTKGYSYMYDNYYNKQDEQPEILI